MRGPGITVPLPNGALGCRVNGVYFPGITEGRAIRPRPRTVAEAVLEIQLAAHFLWLDIISAFTGRRTKK